MVLKTGRFGKRIKITFESFEMRCWRRMEISWTDQVKNKEVLEKVIEEINILQRKYNGLVTSCVETILLTLIVRRSRTGTVWFYTSTNNKRAARTKLYTKSLTRDLKRMYSRLTLVRISIKL